MSTRRQFLQTAAALAVSHSARSAGQRAPDVIFIAIEDASPHRFGCFGGPCLTPHLDAFAASGLRFTDCHTNPPCCPSRTALFLGLRPETTRVFGNDDDYRTTRPDALTMPRHLRQHGFETIRCGKMFHGFADGSNDGEGTWDRVLDPNAGFAAPGPRTPPVGPGAELPKAEQGGAPFVYGPTGRGDLDEHDGRVMEQAIRLLEARPKDARPLFLALGQHSPHLPFCAPDKYHALYPPERMVIPRNPGCGPDGLPVDKPLPVNNPHTVEQWQAAISGHYACISYVDAQIGRLLKYLDESGRAESTIVVIWTDHGFMLGEQYNWRKGPLRDLSTGSLLLWRAPGVTRPGTVCRRPVEAIDIFPTIFELTGVPQAPNTENLSFRRLLAEPEAAWKKGALMWGGRGQSLVTEQWRYCEYPDGRRELFERAKDPGEFENLASRPEQAAVVEELRGLLKGGWRACLPA